MSEITAFDELDEEARRAASTEEAMRAAGVPTHESAQQSYFGFEETHQCFLPDGKSFIEHKTLNEGARRAYLNKVNRDIMLQRTTGNAVMRMQQGEEKHMLLEQAITGWNLIGLQGEPLVFTTNKLQEFLKKADPKIVDLIEKDVRKYNVWLMADLSVEDIDKQISELNEMRDAKIKEDEGNES